MKSNRNILWLAGCTSPELEGITFNPALILVIGFILVVLGFALPVLMVIQVIPSTMFLNFFSYAASVLGVFCGVIGSAFYVARNRRGRK